MTYKAMLVRVSATGGDDDFLTYAAGIAGLFDVHVLGVCAYPALSQSLHMLQMAAGGVVPDDVITDYHAHAQSHIDEAEARFRKAMAGHAHSLSWHSAIIEKSSAAELIQVSRAADLILTNPIGPGRPSDTSRLVAVGDIVMNAGRPVLLVPHAMKKFELGSAVVAWKDTRETRRAVRDALPLLSRCPSVTILEIAAASEATAAKNNLQDVAEWMGYHGIPAEVRVEICSGRDAGRLAGLVHEMGAGLIVAGAYGHARLREWALGGVTEDLLLYPKVPTLLSH